MDYRTRANLRDLLARLYYRDPDIERIVDTAGLNPSTIAWDSRPVNTWQSVLQEAEFHGKLLDVISLARREKPNVQSLALAEQDLLLTVETPLLGSSLPCAGRSARASHRSARRVHLPDQRQQGDSFHTTKSLG